MTSVAHDPLLDSEVDSRYRVISRLADGGMATVYLAMDLRLNRQVALKVLHPHLAADPAFVARFHQEAQSAARLSHPHLVSMFDQFEHDGRQFLAMEYVPGTTLRDLIHVEGPMAPRRAAGVLLPVLDALGYAHREGFLHRDVKPENILIRRDGVVKVADFGLTRAISARTTTATTGVVLGTAAYLAPEQVERGYADARSDVYSAGLLMFETLTGSKAIEGDNPVHVAFQHVHAGVPEVTERVDSVPGPLAAVVARSTSRDPDIRPADAAVMAAALRSALREVPSAQLGRPPVPVGEGAERTAPVRPVVSSTKSAPTGTEGAGSSTSVEVQPSPAGRSPRSRVAIRRRRLVLLAMLLVTIGAAGWFYFFGPASKTTVPPLAGLSVADASKALASNDLAVATKKVYSEKVKAGLVVSSDPSSGATAKRDAVVTLQVSKGPERYDVPKLVGLSQSKAKAALSDGSLTLGTVEKKWSESVPKGEVMSSDPAAGKSVKPKTKVSITVSKGRKPIPIANYVGQPEKAPISKLERAGFTVSRSSEYDASVPRGRIKSQSPSSGTGYRGDIIDIVVSKGPELVAVPQVVRMPETQAVELLQSLGFKVKVSYPPFGGFVKIVRQSSPPAGTSAPKGSTITLVVL